MTWQTWSLVALALAGCARSTIGELEVDAGDTGELSDAGEPGSKSGGGTGGDDGGASSGGASSGGDAGASSGSAGSGTTGGDSGASSGSTCTPMGSCAMPLDLGEVAGNAQGSPISQSGMGSRWFSITVADDNSNGLSQAVMGLALKLTAGMSDYDVSLYKHGDSSCESPVGAQPASGVEYLDYIWGTGGPTAGQTRKVMIEVRKTGATCSPWTLQLLTSPCSSGLVFSGDSCNAAGLTPRYL